MILFKGQRDQLLLPLQAVCGIVEKRHTLPILSNVLLSKNAERLTLLATDIEIQITTQTETIGNDPFSITVAARKLQDILRSLPEIVEITLTMEERRLQLKAGKSRFNLQTLPSDDFPCMSIAKGQGVKICLNQRQLKRLFGLVQYSMAQQDIRYYLNGLLLVSRNNELRLVATDGHRLAYASEVIQNIASSIDVILPRKTILELSKQLSDSEEPIEIELSPNQAVFKFSKIELVSKLIDGKFPDYERVIPQNHKKIIKLSRTLLLQSLMRVAILTNEKSRGVRIVLGNSLLKIISNNTEQEEAQEEIEIDYDGDALDVGFNVTYLLDVLNNVSNEYIELHLADANSSALFILPGNTTFKYVVMPMRI